MGKGCFLVFSSNHVSCPYVHIKEIVKRLGLGLEMVNGNRNREYPQSQEMTVQSYGPPSPIP